MNTVVEKDSWINRNHGWIHPLAASLMLVIAPVTFQSLLDGGGGFSLPHWFVMIGPLLGFFGFAWTAFKVAVTNTLTAKLLSVAILVFGYALIIFEIITLLKH
jgi:hypothetical protein